MTLKSIQVIRREEEAAKLKQQQKWDMNISRIDAVQNDYNTSRLSTGDNYMVQALKKVQQSNVTHDETLTRMNGNWLFNRSIQTESIEDEISEIARDELNKIKPKETSTSEFGLKQLETNKPKVTTEDKDMNWNIICEQLGKKRWEGNPKSFFNKLNEQAQISRKGQSI